MTGAVTSICSANGRDERHSERDAEEQQADRPELGEDLEVEVVGIAGEERVRPVTDPVALVAARPSPEYRVLGELAPGHAPVVGPPASGQVDEPAVQVLAGRPLGRDERVVGIADELRRPARPGGREAAADSGEYDEQSGRRETHAPVQRDAARDSVQGERDGGLDERERDERDRDTMAVAGGGGELRSLSRQGVRARCRLECGAVHESDLVVRGLYPARRVE